MSNNCIWKDTHSIFLETEKLLRESVIKCDPRIAMNSSKKIYQLIPTTFAPTQSSSSTVTISPVNKSCSLGAQSPATKPPSVDTTTSILDETTLNTKPLHIQCLSNDEALQILEFCKMKNYKQRKCKNELRGCPVNTYCTIIDLHERVCPLNISVKMKVEGNMNLLSTTSKKFKPFCKTFLKKYDVLFLYKKNSNDNGIKIYVSGFKKRYKFVIRILSSKFTVIHKIVGFTNSDIYRLPAQLMDTHGPLLNYHIRLQK